MTIPGVGAVVAMTFKAAVDRPERFARSKPWAPTSASLPRQYQSGAIDRTGRISKIGDAMVRTALFEAANVMLTRAVRLSALEAWALRVAGRTTRLRSARSLHLIASCGGRTPTTDRSTSPATQEHDVRD
jgi:transposase